MFNVDGPAGDVGRFDPNNDVAAGDRHVAIDHACRAARFTDARGGAGRPVDVMRMKGGSLLVSDDHARAIYRISYSDK